MIIIDILKSVITEVIMVVLSFLWNIISPLGFKYYGKYMLRPIFFLYHKQTYNKFRFLNVIAIPNCQYQLKQVYITLRLKKGNDLFNSDEEITLIDKFPSDLIQNYKKILIADTAGMGKSTIMKYMFMDLIDNNNKQFGIPIFIELNRLNKKRSVLDVIRKELLLSKIFCNDNSLYSLFQSGNFVFFLDSYDEIPIVDKEEVTQDIQKFISRAGTKNYYIMASRPDNSLACFGDFQSFCIESLEKKEAYKLLSKYDESKPQKVSPDLIVKIKDPHYEAIDDFLENPLLVSLLYAAYNHNADLPLKKNDFYSNVYDALYNLKGQKKHEKKSKLDDDDDFRKVLQFVGYQCLISLGVQFNKERILDCIEKAFDFCEIKEAKASGFLNDLLTSVPLFTRDGTDYKWVHKSLLDYFAANFIFSRDAEKDKILSNIYASDNFENYANMLDIYFGIDPDGFSKNITLPFCVNYLKFYNTYFNTNPQIEIDSKEERISTCFLRHYGFIISSNPENIELKKYFPRFNSNCSQFRNKPLTIHLKDRDYYIHVIWEHNIKKDLVSLLHKLYNPEKNPTIFKKYDDLEERKSEYNQRPYKLNLYNTFGFEPCDVKIDTGVNHKDIYKSVNILINRSDWFIDYNACKKMISSINNKISNNMKFQISKFGVR